MLTKREQELFKLKAELHKALGDSKRLVIIAELRKGQKSVGDLVRIMAVPQAAVSRHLAVLRERGIVQSRREGTSVFYSLADPRICDESDIMQEILLTRIRKSHQLII